MDQQPERTITVVELADLLGVSKDTVYAMARSGAIPSMRVGRLWRFSWSDVREHLAQTRAGRDPWARSAQSEAGLLREARKRVSSGRGDAADRATLRRRSR